MMDAHVFLLKALKQIFCLLKTGRSDWQAKLTAIVNVY